jgi:hypothetical protein
VSYSRARRVLLSAERILAVGEGDVRRRLRMTYRHLRSLSAEELPAELRAEWKIILRDMTRCGPQEKHEWSALEHTMRCIRNSTGKRIAERIYILHARLSH